MSELLTPEGLIRNSVGAGLVVATATVLLYVWWRASDFASRIKDDVTRKQWVRLWRHFPGYIRHNTNWRAFPKVFLLFGVIAAAVTTVVQLATVGFLEVFLA